MAAEPITLDLARPVASLLEQAGLTAYGLGKLANQRTQSIDGHVARGAGIGLDTLAKLAHAVGYEVELRLRRIEEHEA